MQNNIIKIYLSFIFFLFGLFHSLTIYSACDSLKTTKTVASDSSRIEIREPAAEKQKELLNNPEYKYDRVGPAPKTPWQRFKEWLSRKIQELFSSKGGEISLTILKYALIIAAIVLIVFLLLKNNIRSLFYGKSARVAIDFKEFEEDIHTINFDELIAIALSEKDFRRAVRLHFLKLLKELTTKNLIAWKIDKTNKDYHIDLLNTQCSSSFKELAFLYEYIWYGDFQLDVDNFRITIEKFKSFTI